MEKITKREMFESIIAFIQGGEMKFNSQTYVEFCEREIALLDKKAEKAKERAAKKKEESDELTEAIVAVMSSEEFESIADIAVKVEGEDVTAAKVSYRLTQLVKAGRAEKQQITVEGSEGQKSRKIMAYKLCV